MRQPGTSKILRNHGVRDVQGVGYAAVNDVRPHGRRARPLRPSGRRVRETRRRRLDGRRTAISSDLLEFRDVRVIARDLSCFVCDKFVVWGCGEMKSAETARAA